MGGTAVRHRLVMRRDHLGVHFRQVDAHRAEQVLWLLRVCAFPGRARQAQHAVRPNIGFERIAVEHQVRLRALGVGVVAVPI